VIESNVHEITPLVQLAEAWSTKRLTSDQAWIGHVRGKTFWAEEQPEKVFCKVLRVKDFDLSEVDEPVCQVQWPSGRHKLLLPESYRTNAPYEGRQHITNESDCYTLACDWFRRERGWEMPPVVGNQADLGTGGKGDWFTTHPEVSNWERVVVGNPGDGVYFTFGERSHPNHCGVLLEDNMLLHHFYGRLSCIEPFTGIWKQSLTCYMSRKHA